MMRKSKLLAIVYCSALLTGIACTKAQTSHLQNVSEPEKEPGYHAVEPIQSVPRICDEERVRQHRPPTIRNPAYEKVHSVRSIDFKNFKYPGVWGPDIDVPSSPFRLARGQHGDWRDGMKFDEISYGDVYGDRSEEAIVSLRVLTDGNQIHNAVYVFTIIRNRPRVIFFFESGDRAAGGLRKAYGEKGQFVVELWGAGKALANLSPATNGDALCCPTTFTRSSYQWRDGAFEEQSCDILPNPEA